MEDCDFWKMSSFKKINDLRLREKNMRSLYAVRCTIWYHLYNLKNVKNIHGGVLILVTFQGSACNITKINTPPWMFFRFLKLCKWYQIAHRTTYFKQTDAWWIWRKEENIWGKVFHCNSRVQRSRLIKIVNTPRKHQDFLMCSGGTERVHWEQIN